MTPESGIGRHLVDMVLLDVVLLDLEAYIDQTN
jgi:hypothetical protein